MQKVHIFLKKNLSRWELAVESYIFIEKCGKFIFFNNKKTGGNDKGEIISEMGRDWEKVDCKSAQA